MTLADCPIPSVLLDPPNGAYASGCVETLCECAHGNHCTLTCNDGLVVAGVQPSCNVGILDFGNASCEHPRTDQHWAFLVFCVVAISWLLPFVWWNLIYTQWEEKSNAQFKQIKQRKKAAEKEAAAAQKEAVAAKEERANAEKERAKAEEERAIAEEERAKAERKEQEARSATTKAEDAAAQAENKRNQINDQIQEHIRAENQKLDGMHREAQERAPPGCEARGPLGVSNPEASHEIQFLRSLAEAEESGRDRFQQQADQSRLDAKKLQAAADQKKRSADQKQQLADQKQKLADQKQQLANEKQQVADKKQQLAADIEVELGPLVESAKKRGAMFLEEERDNPNPRKGGIHDVIGELFSDQFSDVSQGALASLAAALVTVYTRVTGKIGVNLTLSIPWCLDVPVIGFFLEIPQFIMWEIPIESWFYSCFATGMILIMVTIAYDQWRNDSSQASTNEEWWEKFIYMKDSEEEGATQGIRRISFVLCELCYGVLFMQGAKLQLMIMDCTYPDDPSKQATLDAAPSLECWTPLHFCAVAVTILVFPVFLFFSLRHVVKGKSDFTKDTAFKWEYSLYSTAVLLVSIAVGVFFSNYAWTVAIINFVADLALLTMVWPGILEQTREPCKLPLINFVLVYGWTVCLCASVCGLVATAVDDPESQIMTWVLLLGFLLITGRAYWDARNQFDHGPIKILFAVIYKLLESYLPAHWPALLTCCGEALPTVGFQKKGNGDQEPLDVSGTKSDDIEAPAERYPPPMKKMSLGSDVLREGLCEKQSETARKWNVRYLVVKAEGGRTHLRIYHTQTEWEKGSANFKAIELLPHDKFISKYDSGNKARQFTFLQSDGEKKKFRVASQNDRDKWVEALNEIIADRNLSRPAA